MAVHFFAAHSWASPPGLQTEVESMMVNLLQSDNDYDVALLRYDLRVKNTGLTAISLPVGQPILLEVFASEGDRTNSVYQTHTSFMEFGDSPGPRRTHLLRPGAFYVYKGASCRVPVHRHTEDTVGLRYGKQRVSFVFGFEPARNQNVLTELRTEAYELTIPTASNSAPRAK